MTRSRAAAVLILGSLALSRVAVAEPLSRWDRARNPEAAKAEQALAEALETRVGPIEGLLGAADLSDVQEFLRARAFDAAMRLELRGAEALPSPELWYFLGSTLISADRHRDEDGRRILTKALAAAPDSPLAARAWFDVAVASNRLLDFEAERSAYGQALRVVWDEDERATIFANRAEASMSLGDLRAARDDYLTALGLATPSGSEVYALAAWGLAVADARDDDLPDALKYAWTASQMLFPVWSDATKRIVPTQAIDLSSVFFTPEYEIFFYRALGEMAAAEHAEGERERNARLSRAVELWDDYLAPARRHGDRWIQNAEFHRRWCERRLGGAAIRPPSGLEPRGGSGSRSRRPPPTPAPG